MCNLTEKEQVELILNFKTGVRGYWKEEISKYFEATKFINSDNTEPDGEHPDLICLNETGELEIHKYIEKISKQFITYCKGKSFNVTYDEVNKWFQTAYNLEDYKSGEEIASYICSNLEHYGYSAKRAFSSLRGDVYIVEKINN